MAKCKNCINLKNHWCDMVADSPDENAERECCTYERMTNADKIRSMSDEELEVLINKIKMCGGLIRTEESSIECHGCKDGFCCNVKEWLQSEVEE